MSRRVVKKKLNPAKQLLRIAEHEPEPEYDGETMEPKGVNGYSLIGLIEIVVTKNNYRWVPYSAGCEECVPSKGFERYPIEEDIEGILDNGDLFDLCEEKLTFDNQLRVICEMYGMWTTDYWGEHDAEFFADEIVYQIEPLDEDGGELLDNESLTVETIDYEQTGK